MPKLAEIAGIGKKGGGDGYVAPSLTIISATPTSGGTIQEGQTLTVTLGGAGIYEGDSIDYTISSVVSVADITLTSLTGSIIVGSGGTATLTFNIVEDLTTEGAEFGQIAFSVEKPGQFGGTITSSLLYNFVVADTSTTPSTPTYVLGTNKNSVDEGENFIVTLTTAAVSAGTSVAYTITGVTSADIGGASLTGNFVTGTTDAITFNVTADASTETTETFTLTLDNGADDISVTINDTSLDPTYSLSASRASVNEGENFTVSLTTTDVAQSTTVPYTITGVSSADINTASLTGNFVVGADGTASLLVETSEDASLSEGTETFTLTLDNGADNVSVTINDTSIDTTPAYTNFTLTGSSSINESGSTTFRITGRNIAQNTTVVVTAQSVTGTISGSDFANSSVSRTITWTGTPDPVTQSQDFTVQMAADDLTEGEESFKLVLAATDSAGTNTGSLESPTVTIEDTSLTVIKGQIEWEANGTITNNQLWQVPAGVTSISMVAVGGGGGGAGCANFGSAAGGGGGGGGLSYVNNVTVVPNEFLQIRAGGGGTGGTRGYGGSSGVSSLVRRGGSVLLNAGAGEAGSITSGGQGGNYSSPVGDTYYYGGSGGSGASARGGGGGGASGYAGDGGDGANGNNFGQAGNGSGGGGGGAGSSITNNNSTSGGGGVGNKGQGSNGVGGTLYNDGGGGSSGEDGQNGIGGDYGGGGGGTSRIGNPSLGAGQNGGPGTVRIIWPGTSRQFPTTRTADERQVDGTYDSISDNSSTNTIVESAVGGDSTAQVSFTIATTDVPEGTTVGYTIVQRSGTINSSDFKTGPGNPGIFTIEADGTATITLQAEGDFSTEGNEVFFVRLASTDSIGNETNSLESADITISDTYPATVYNSISLDKVTYNEGDTVTISVDYTNNTDKSIQVPYTATTTSGASTDLNQTSGVLTLLGGTTYEGGVYSTSKTIIASDLTTEGDETLTITLGSTDNKGNSTGSPSTTATIADTSQAPRVPGSALVGIINEPARGTTVNGKAMYPYVFGEVLAGDNDIVVLGDPLAEGRLNSAGGVYGYNCGQVYVYNRSNQSIINLIESPWAQSSNPGEYQAYFGQAITMCTYAAYKYLIIAAPRYKNPSTNEFEMKIMIYRTMDNFANYTLLQTITAHTSAFTGGGSGLTNSQGRFPRFTKFLDGNEEQFAIAFNGIDGNNNAGNGRGYVRVYEYDYSTGGFSEKSVVNQTTNQFNDTVTICQSNNTLFTGCEGYDYVLGSQNWQDVGLFRKADLDLNYSNFIAGNSLAGGAGNYGLFGLGNLVAHGGLGVAVSSAGDDYSGYQDVGRIRFYQVSNMALRATANNPSVDSTSNDQSGLNAVKALSGNANASSSVAGFIGALWNNIYDSTLNKVVIYDQYGNVKYTLNSPGNTVIGSSTWNMRWSGDVHVTDNHVYIHANEGAGFSVNQVYIY